MWVRTWHHIPWGSAGWTLAALLALGAPLSAQEGTLTGLVLNAETGGPVVQAQVQILGGGETRTVVTDAQGLYQANVPAGTYDIVVQSLGYLGARLENVGVADADVAVRDVGLVPAVLALDGIVVSASRGAMERATQAPATTHIVSAVDIVERPASTPADHLRSAPGVDVITTGLQGTNVVVRGFNNIFSGALHMLTDYRLAGVPSLRVNLMHFVPTTDEDIEKIEVVLGPASALYGPDTANGVVHTLTKSPLTSQGTSVTLGGGEQSVFQGSFRSAFLLSETLGFKISGQYFTGEEWDYVDATEQAARDQIDANPARCLADRMERGLDQAAAQLACDRVGVRDFDIERFGFEARADWRFGEDGTVVGTYGRTDATGIEMTGLGAGQVNGWIYEFYQARVNMGRTFGQLYYNTSDAGDTYLLRDGSPLSEESSLLVAQAQHGLALANGREDLTFGVDYFATTAESNGTIYGSYEDDDDVNVIGAYVQSKTALTPRLDLILAGRFDSHTALQEDIWSPRAGLVFRPEENQSFRFTYNRAFSTTTNLNLFLDVSGGFAPDPLGPLGYGTRAFGTGPDGYAFQNADGSLKGVRSPFNPG